MRAFCIATTLFALSIPQASLADSISPPGTYKTTSADGKFVFVMIPNISLADELKQYNEQHQQVVKAIRDVYTQSGMYKNAGSKKPLWTVDRYIDSVDVANDGVHLVAYGRWAVLGNRLERNPSVTQDDLKQEAVSFYASGKLLRKYSIGEFVDDPKQLPMSISHFGWLKESRIIDAKKQFELLTLDNNRIVIDLTTAKIVEKKRK